MLGVWSISSVSRLWRLYRLFHQRPAVPIEFTAIVCQALHLPLILPPRLALLFTCFGDLAGGSKSSTLGMSARVWSVRGVSGCGRVIQLRSDVVESSLDELIETSDVEDFFSYLVDRLTLLGHSEARIQGVRWSPHRFTDWNIRKCFPWELGNENINMGWGEVSRICGRPYYNILTGQVKSISNLMMLYLLARPDVASV